MSEETLNRVIKYMEQTNGRDKISRLLQYGSRFLAWWFVNNQRKDLAEKFTKLESANSTARKLFRLLKSLQSFQAAVKASAQQSDPVVKLTTVVQQLALGLWLLYDHVILAASLGFTKPNDTVKRRANICWLVAMIAGIVKSVYLLQQTQQLIAQQSTSSAPAQQKAETIESLRRRQFEFFLELSRNIFDVPIPLTGLSQSVAAVIPSGVVGLCGTVSSIIGIQQVWSKTK